MTSTPADGPTGVFDRGSLGGPAAGAREAVLDRKVPGIWSRSLEWSATSAPVALLLVAGITIGPQGINLLSPAVLSLLAPVVPVALAALGVLVGLGVDDRRTDHWRVFAAASLDVAVTILVVTAGSALILLAAPSSFVRPSWTLVLIGLCAATSLTLPTGNPLEPRLIAARVTEISVLFPIIAGGVVLAWLSVGSLTEAVTQVAQASGVTLALAAAGWLLLTRESSETEERVLTVAALLLVGGVAGALSLSALFGGLVAGVFWRYAGQQPRDTIGRDVLFVQHPLLILVLLVAGARANVSPASLGLAGAYLLLRVTGKLIGGTAARRVLGARAPDSLKSHLLPPGVFGVAFALNAVTIVDADASVVLTAVVVGTIGSEFIAFLLPARRVGE